MLLLQFIVNELQMNLIEEQDWFSNWFNSPYYHILYKNRNEQEAEGFMDALLSKINLKDNARITDIACGRGRHAIYLNKKGFDVTGVDFSPESIYYAKKWENETLHFAVHDMRRPFITNYFDAAFNLFTSLGYFKNEHENKLAIKTMQLAVKKGGIIVIDFLNAYTATRKIVQEEVKVIDNVYFTIKKQLKSKTLIKDIAVKDGEKHFQFFEKVLALTIADFENYLKTVGVKILNLYGDYSLNEYIPNQSERLIIVGEKL